MKSTKKSKNLSSSKAAAVDEAPTKTTLRIAFEFVILITIIIILTFKYNLIAPNVSFGDVQKSCGQIVERYKAKG